MTLLCNFLRYAHQLDKLSDQQKQAIQDYLSFVRKFCFVFGFAVFVVLAYIGLMSPANLLEFAFLAMIGGLFLLSCGLTTHLNPVGLNFLLQSSDKQITFSRKQISIRLLLAYLFQFLRLHLLYTGLICLGSIMDQDFSWAILWEKQGSCLMMSSLLSLMLVGGDLIGYARFKKSKSN